MSARPAFWRIVIGFIAISLIYFFFAFATIWVLFWAMQPDLLYTSQNGPPQDILYGTTPAGVLTLLFSFIGGWIGVAVINKVLHRMPVRQLLSPDGRVHYRSFTRAALLALGFSFAVTGLTLLISGQAIERSGLHFWQWCVFLPLALSLIALQTGAEELFFRGYLQGRLGARFRSPLMWAVLPSLLFGALHYSPELDGEAALFVAAATTVLALFLAGLTARTGSLWAPWGVHFGINTGAMLFVGTEGWLSGLSLWLVPADPATTMIGELIVHFSAALGGAALLLWLDRRVRTSQRGG